MNNWEKCFSRNGCPYYLNLSTLQSQWEHPYLKKILDEAADYDDVIYAAYRTALKLLHIRNNLQLQSLDVEKIESAFTNLLPLRDLQLDEYLTLTQLDEVVYKLHRYCDTPLSQPVWTGAMSSCLLYFFDGKKRGTVNVVSVLVLLTTLSSDVLTNKYSFLFQCLSQHDLVGAQDICHLKKTVFTMLARLHEDKAYKNTYEGNGTTMTKDMFLKWLLTEPKFIVWLSTLHRIHAAITVVHAAKCYRCRNSPIVGLRYRCLQCFNVDLCFQCFTRIPAYGKHDRSHAVEEYCLPSNKMQDMRAFITKLRNNVKKKSKQSKAAEQQFDLTARRQPATVWNDPRSTEGNNSSIKAQSDVSATNSYRASPAPEQRMRGPPSGADNSLTLKSVSADNHQKRYCQSLPRRSKPRAAVQSPPPSSLSHHSDYLYERPAPRHQSSHLEPSHQYQGRQQYARSNEQYVTISHMTHPTNTTELDFYSSARPSTSAHAHNGTSRSVKRSQYSNAYSEDEGIVVNSESDSSVSHFTSYDNRDQYKVPGQCSEARYNTYSRYNQQQAVYGLGTQSDYTHRTWADLNVNKPPLGDNRVPGRHDQGKLELHHAAPHLDINAHRDVSPLVVRAYQV